MRQRRWVIGTAGLAVLLSACGTRLPDKAFQKNQQVKLKASTGALSGGTGSEQAATGGTGATQATTTGATQAVTGGTGGGGTTGGTTTGGTGGPKSPSGQGNFASDVGVTADSIKIGNVTAIGGALGPNAFGVTLNGLKTFVSAINDQGGVNGRKLVLDPCDDGADGTRNLSCTQKLVEQDKVFSLLGNNTDASASSANYEFKKGIPDVGFPLNNGYYKYPNMYSIYGVGYARDGKTVGNNGKLENTSGIYRYFKQQAHATKAAVFYYIIPVSAQAGCFEEQGALKEGIPTVYEGGGGNGHCLGAGENPAAPAFDQDVLNMRQAGVDVMFDAMDVSANERLCQAMDRQQFKVKAKVSTIEVWGDIVGNEFSAPCRNSVFVAGLSASYSELSNPMVARFRSDLSKYGPNYPLHQWTLEGWALGNEFVEAVKTLGANVTRKGYMGWLEGLNQYTMNGLFTPLDYRKVDYTKPTNSCNTIAQWQDSAHKFVTREPVTYCVTVNYYTTPALDDGS